MTTERMQGCPMKSVARNTVAGAFLLVFIAAALPAAAQSTAEVAARQPHSRQAPGVSLAAGSRYQAGGLHRFLWGDNYRRLWAAPIVVPTLDLKRYAGGLRPTGRGGGHQTISLHLSAADGHRYSFRSVDKNAIQVLQLHPPAAYSRFCRDRSVGNQQVMVVPTPSSLSAETRPPWASTRCFTMARPSPVPPWSRERAGSER